MKNLYMDSLQRYESKYFNCKRTKIVSYLKFKGLPIELLFYNSCDNINNLYNQFVVENKESWSFKTECFSREYLNLLGVNVVDKQFNNFLEAEQYINELNQQDKFTLLSGDLYYLDYKQNHYKKEHILHYLVCMGFSYKNGDKYYNVLDDNSSAMGDFILREIDEQRLKASFDNSIKIVSFVEIEEEASFTINKIKVLDKFTSWLRGFDCDLKFYDILPKVIENSIIDDVDSNIVKITRLFTKITGSRALFSKFLDYIGDNSDISKNFHYCSNQAEIITNLLVKFNISKKINMERIVDKCAFLRETEERSIKILKARYLK